MPDKPFFVYFAPGATHAPHHVPKEWADKYAGPVRRRLGRAARAHVRPPEGAGRHPGRRRADRPPRRDPGLGRHARRAQAGARPRDGGVRRVPRAHRPPRRPAASTPSRISAILDDTIVYYIIGDNGASAEGTLNGAFNEMANFNGMAALETPEFMLSKMDELGSPTSYNHYAVGWAWAMDTPFQWTKQVASHWGGTRNGTIVHWPNGIEEKGGLRSQFTHVIDVAPTILEAAGLPEPTMVNGVQQSPMEGTSMLYTFNDAGAAGAPRPAVLRDVRQPRHLPQGLERGHQAPHAVGDGRRRHAGVRRRRVGALRRHAATTARPTTSPPSNPRCSPSCNGSGSSRPTKYNVLPIDDRTAERLEPATRRTTDPHPRELAAVLRRAWDGCRRTAWSASRTSRSPSPPRSTSPTAAPNGVIIAQGGRFGGWARLRQGRQGQVRLQRARHPRVRDRRRRADPRRHPPGAHGVRLRRRRAGQGRRRHPLLRRHRGRRPAGSSTPSR